MSIFKKKIVVYSRKDISNYGDPIIGDCCKYLIEKTAKEDNIRVKVTIADIYCKYRLYHKAIALFHNIFVFPGGGMNSVKFCEIVLERLLNIETNPKKKVYFNAIGIKTNLDEKNAACLKQIYGKECVKQVTTRGDLEEIKKYVPASLPAPVLVFDPAMWVNEAYQISRSTDSDIIGVGVIRPDIWKSNGNDFSEENVILMYENIINELGRRGYRWQLFTNGMAKDHAAGVRLLKKLGLNKNEYIGENIGSPRELVQKISGFRAVIASRLHANIISSSLGIPSIGLVWNVKMNLFSEILGCPQRYINVENLLDAKLIVDRMERAIEEGYDLERIDAMKEVTVNTIKTMLR